MIPNMLQDEGCPVEDDLLGRLYASHRDGVSALVDRVPPATRARLALYCYRRAHLQDIGLAIAATCERADLVEIGARVGEVVYLRAQEAAETQPPAHPTGRRKVTLATAAMMAPRFIVRDEDPDEDGAETDAETQGAYAAA